MWDLKGKRGKRKDTRYETEEWRFTVGIFNTRKLVTMSYRYFIGRFSKKIISKWEIYLCTNWNTEILVGDEKRRENKTKQKPHSRSDWILEDVAQTCHGVSILEHGQNLTGHGPEQPARTQSAFSEVLDWMISRSVKLKSRFKWHWIKVYSKNKKEKGMMKGSLTLENNLFCSHMV